jgi:hypothetical protein
MKKIPVSDTVRYAYSFTFGHLGTIIGLIWLPTVILAIAGYFVMAYYYGTVPDAVTQGNPVAIGQSALAVMAWGVVSMLLYAISYSAVTRQALGLRQGSAVIYFHFGAGELRVFGLMLGLTAVLSVFIVADFAFSGIFSTFAAKVPALKAAAPIAYLAGLCAIFYAMVRLSFLALPATVAEDSVALGRAWELSRGNFWRIVAIGLSTLLPLFLVMGMAEITILGPDAMVSHVATKGSSSAEEMRAMAAQMRAASQQLPLLSGLAFLIAPFLTGLTVAPAVFAYRALTSTRDSALPQQG